MEFLNAIPDWLGIIILAFVIGLANTLSYRFLTDLKRMRALRKKLKGMLEEYKKKKEEKLLEEIDKVQAEYLRLSFRPMIAGTVLALLFLPILVGTYGDVSGKGSVALLGRNLSVDRVGEKFVVGNITTDGVFEFGGKIWEIRERDGRYVVSRVILLLPFELPFVGRTVGWILFYILVSLPIVFALRKILGIEP